METRVVTDERLVAAVSHDDPLASRTAVTLGTIREWSLISLPRGTGIRTLVDDACASVGFRPRIAFEAGDPNVLAQLASRGLGVAVLPESLADFYREQLHAIIRPKLRGRLEVAWRAEGPISPPARALSSAALATCWKTRPPTDDERRMLHAHT